MLRYTICYINYIQFDYIHFKKVTFFSSFKSTEFWNFIFGLNWSPWPLLNRSSCALCLVAEIKILIGENLRNFQSFKGSSDPNFIFEINFGKRRIRHRTTLNLNDAIFNRIEYLNFGVVLCRIRLFPTLISKIKWFRSELPLTF